MPSKETSVDVGFRVRAWLPLDLWAQVVDLVPFQCQVAIFNQDDYTVTLWGREGPQHILRSSDAGGAAASPTFGFHFFPLGDRAVTFFEDGTWTIWDTATGVATQELHGGGAVRCAQVFPDGNRIVLCADGGFATWQAYCAIWTVDSDDASAALVPLQSPDPIAHVAVIPPRGRRAIGHGGRAAAATVWDTSTGLAVCESPRHLGSIFVARTFPAGDRCLTVGQDQRAIIWSVAAANCGAPLAEFYLESEAAEAVLLDGGDALATLSPTGRVTLHRLDRAGPALVVPTPTSMHEGFFGLEAFPDGRRLAAWGSMGAVVWDAVDGRIVSEITSDEHWTSSLAASVGGDVLFTCGSAGLVVWDVASGTARKIAGTSFCGYVAVAPTSALGPSGFARGLSWREVLSL